LNWINLILFLGAAQGLLLALLLFHKHRFLVANRILAVLMFSYSIILIHLVSDELGVFRQYIFIKYVLEIFPLLVGPMHYLYAKYMVRNSEFFDKSDLRHGFLGLLYFFYRMIFIMNGGVSEPGPYHESLTFEYVIYNWVITIQVIVYLFLTLKLVFNYADSLKNMFSSFEKIRLDWLRNITIIMMAVVFFFILENVLYLAGISFSPLFDYSSVLVGISVYIMGYLGLSRSEIFASAEILEPLRHLKDVTNISPDTSPAPYEKSGLSEEKALIYEKKLMQLMEDGLYRDSTLTLNSLALKLDISAHNLSEIINTRIKQNFFDFVNSYRVKQVKNDLSQESKQNLTLLAIAFDAGFNSKSSFNAVFKKHTGKTPSQYRDSISNNS